MYLDKLKLRAKELEDLYLCKDNLAHNARLIPCTEEEIETLESRLQLSLPDAYKEFLLWGGNWARGLMRDSFSFFNSLLKIQEVAVELLE